jgi:hypothetical protein
MKPMEYKLKHNRSIFSSNKIDYMYVMDKNIVNSFIQTIFFHSIRFLVVFALFLGSGCRQHDNPKNEISSKKLDSSARAKLLDTTNMNTCPVEILNSNLALSAKPKIHLYYQNKSDSKIRSIHFLWYGTNAENKPADNGLEESGVSGGIDENGLGPNEYGNNTWFTGGKNMKKVVAIWPSEVIYADGRSWHAGRR